MNHSPTPTQNSPSQTKEKSIIVIMDCEHGKSVISTTKVMETSGGSPDLESQTENME
jgi:hypothetical protein